MVSQEEYVKHEGLEIGFYIFFGVLMAIVIPLIIGFGFKGFEESFVSGRSLVFGDLLTTYLIYYILIVAAMAVIVFPIMNLLFIRKGEHPATQENPKWWRAFTVSLIHNPEQSALYTMARKLDIGQKKKFNWMKWSLSLIRMLAIGTIIFSALGILSVTVPEAQIVGIPQGIEQQITPMQEVIFTAEPPAFSETGTMLFVFLFLLGLNAWFTARFKLGIEFFFIIGFVVICPLIGFMWLGFHNIVYSASDQARFATFFFGWIGSTLTLLFGSWTFWYSWHFWNNFFAKIREVQDKLPIPRDDLVALLWLLWFVFLVIYVGIEIYSWKRKQRKKRPDYLSQVPVQKY